MFKRFFNWLLGAQPAPPEEPQTRRGSGMWSTDVPERDRGADPLADRMGELAALRPKFVAGLGGVAMDSELLSADGPGSHLKDAYHVGQWEGVTAAITDWFLSQRFIGHQLAGMIAQHWLIDKCCLIPARDAVRHGYDIHTSDGGDIDAPEVLNLMKALDKRYRINKNMIEWVYKGKIFGIRIAFFKVTSTDPLYYEQPFNIDGVTPGSYKGIVQVDPYWCIPELDMAASTDPSSMHFYEPTYWVINGKRYHRSHLMIYREGDVIDILKPSYMYGGIPLPQKIMERVYAAERTANEAPQLAMTKRTRIVQTEIEEGIALGPKYAGRLAEMVELQDNYGVTMGDKDDVITQLDTALSDLDVVIMSQFQLVAATANIPGTKLLQTTPKGFNATGEYEEASYHEELESVQASLTDMLERHHQLCMHSAVIPAMRKRDVQWKPFETSVSWHPLDSPTALEYAQMNLTKAQAGAALVQSGAIDGYDERDRIRNDKNSDYTGIAEALRPDEDNDGEPDAPAVGTPQTPAPTGFDSDLSAPELITNQIHLDPDVVLLKRAEQDYDVQVSPVIIDSVTGNAYRVVIDGHHSLEAAKLDGVPANLIEGGWGESDYFSLETGEPL